MKKILMISPAFPPDFGGAGVQAVLLAKALQKKGVSVEFVSDNGLSATTRETYGELTVNRFKSARGAWGDKLRETIFLSKVFVFVLLHPEFEILHFHSMGGFEAFLYPIFRIMGKKILLKLTLAGNDDPLTLKNRKCLGWFYLWSLCFVDRIVAISQKLVNLATAAGIDSRKVSLIYNGVDADRFVWMPLDEKKETRENLNIRENSKVFLSIGRIESRKGYDFLLKAYREISLRMADSVLLIIGPGNSMENSFYVALQRYIVESGLNSVQFLGQIADVHPYINVADCFLFCSREEGFGTVLIEAMACGVPTIAMNIPDITEDIIKDNDIGRICYSSNPGDFTDQVTELLRMADPHKRRLSAKRVQDRFSISAIADRYIKIYERLLGKG